MSRCAGPDFQYRMQRIPATQVRSSGWEFDPAVAGCGLQGTANSPSSTTVIEPSCINRNAGNVRCAVPGLPSGAERNRTADLQIAILALSQLSYCPKITERVGFEPTVHMVNTRSPGVPIQPLSHLSQVFRPSAFRTGLSTCQEYKSSRRSQYAYCYSCHYSNTGSPSGSGALISWCFMYFPLKQIAHSRRRVRWPNLTKTTAKNNSKFTQWPHRPESNEYA